MQRQAEWTRETPWRQGHVLCQDACTKLELKHPQHPDDTCVVVIGHDCDLANSVLEAEPWVDVIVGRISGKFEGNFAWGKAPRTLHLEMLREGKPVVVELVATEKATRHKRDVAPFLPDAQYELDATQLGVLRSWLGARYNRTAFPDAFVNRMKATKADVRLNKVIEPKGALISFIYFKLDDGQMVERKDGDPYEVSIVLVYPPGDDPEKAADNADMLAQEVFADLERRLPHSPEKPNQQIILKGCFAVSEDDVTVAQSRMLAQWRLEYMSLRAEDDQLGPPDA